MKKKLLWMIDGLGPGGAEHLMPGILSNIHEFDQRVCALLNKNGNPIGAEIEKLGIPVDLLEIPNLRHPANLAKMLRYFRQHKPDILHTQLEFSNTLGSLAARLYGIPSLCTLHTLDDRQKNEKTYWRHRLMWGSLKLFAARIIAVSDSTREHHIRVGGLPPFKVITMHNGIDLQPFAPEHNHAIDALRAELNIPAESRVLVTVAVLREPKGIQNMLHAMPQILERIPNALYLIVGDGAHAQELKTLTNSLGIEQHVRFAGYRKDVARFLALSEIFVLPTLDDALPTVLMEAMAAKKPLIASRVGGVPEILQDEVNGILIPPADVDALATASIQLLTDKQKAQAMAAAGKLIADEEFNVRQQAKKLEKLYQEILTHYGK